MATFMVPALPAGHWAIPAGAPAAPTALNQAGITSIHCSILNATAKNVFVYDGIPDVDKVHEWGEAHAANHNALAKCDADLAAGVFNSYDYLAYQVPPTLPNRLQEWMNAQLVKIAGMVAVPLINPAAAAGPANPPLPLIMWFLIRFYLSEFPKNLTAGYHVTLSNFT
ncbi:hypothetical protein HDU86_007517 [Geranomyces michiganensis]|nr:hypothetical protein HDU86_007517 [Geranomyces michiganensis]